MSRFLIDKLFFMDIRNDQGLLEGDCNMVLKTFSFMPETLKEILSRICLSRKKTG